MKYYYSKLTGKIITDTTVKAVKDVLGEVKLDSLLTPMESPSVVDCILGDNKVAAVMRYHEIHSVRLIEARKGVEKIEESIKFYRRKH